MKPTAQASFADGQTASAQPVTLFFEADGLRICALNDGKTLGPSDGQDGDQEIVFWPWADTRLNGMQVGVVHVEVSSHPGAELTVPEGPLAETLRQRCPSRRLIPGGQRPRTAALVLTLVFVSLGAGTYFMVPTLAGPLAQHVPLAWEAELGVGVASMLESSVCTGDGSEEAEISLDALTSRLVGQRATAPIAVHIVNHSTPNAFALPGGIIILTRGLIHEAESPDEVAGVLAHEIAHVQHRHVMAHIIRASIMSAVWALTVGDLAGLMVLDPSTIHELVQLRFSREDETQADDRAVELLNSANISTNGLATFFERRAKEDGFVPAFLSSHPSSNARAQATQAKPGTKQLDASLNKKQWAALRTACTDMAIDELPEFLQDNDWTWSWDEDGDKNGARSAGADAGAN